MGLKRGVFWLSPWAALLSPPVRLLGLVISAAVHLLAAAAASNATMVIESTIR